jgi:hypothetical protein
LGYNIFWIEPGTPLAITIINSFSRILRDDAEDIELHPDEHHYRLLM